MSFKSYLIRPTNLSHPSHELFKLNPSISYKEYLISKLTRWQDDTGGLADTERNRKTESLSAY